MTWVEIAAIVLLVDLAWRVGRALVLVARTVKESVDHWPRIPPERVYRPTPSTTTQPDYVEVASEHVVALDYSSGPKRH